MPADYTSTAQALSVSTSPPSPLSPAEDDEDNQMPWSRLTPGRHRSAGLALNEPPTLWDQVVERYNKTSRHMWRTWRRMTLWQRVGAVFAALLLNVIAAGFLAFTGKVFIWLGPVAEQWESSPWVFIALWWCVFFVSFPPLVGWSTFGTMAGYIFGIWKGWALYATASVLGSTCSLIVSRTILSGFVHRLMERDKRFAALSLTLKYDGLKLLCMIRLCPLPYSICNGAVSTFPSVQPLTYGLATAIISPKLLVPAFIGSRIRLLYEKNQEMSIASKAVNVCSIFATICIGVFTGWYIYRRTLARAKELEEQERAGLRSSSQTDRAFSEDSSSPAAAPTRARDEERIDFNDFDDDNIDLVIDDESGSDHSLERRKSRGLYHDEFTDHDSEFFQDGDGAAGEMYSLHNHVRRSPDV
ncbi:hypothetical protein BDW42DRAFT_177889 [Aspergillus taichungensis]|uniref:Golgi apparatus membrane protein TVP38 n=1 Tax=Aspergillus taichungensis TaxID=482145 RepID=A0A2J5HIX0_9EURO|nr:hypothetical protein BDW42DRAFT_177889 [Aspergillus taichungensis]